MAQTVLENQTVRFDASTPFVEGVQVVNLYKDRLGYTHGFALIPSGPMDNEVERTPVIDLDLENILWKVDFDYVEEEPSAPALFIVETTSGKSAYQVFQEMASQEPMPYDMFPRSWYF